MEGGGRSEGARGGVDMKEVRQVWRGQVMDGFVCVHEDFVNDPLVDGEPVELLKDGGDVVGRGSF